MDVAFDFRPDEPRRAADLVDGQRQPAIGQEHVYGRTRQLDRRPAKSSTVRSRLSLIGRAPQERLAARAGISAGASAQLRSEKGFIKENGTVRDEGR